MKSSRLAIASLIAFALLSSACGLTEFEEELDTEFTVPKPTSFESGTYLKTKRFKFDNDPADAESAVFKRAYIEVIAPDNHDLTFMDSIQVYADADGELTLLASASEFETGQRYRRLNIDMGGDLRHLTRNQRLNLVFEVVPSRWHLSLWPSDGITIRAGVTLLIEADIF
jgi:hypothetical protein